MKKSLAILIAANLVLTSCGWSDSRANPRNWFGKSTSSAIVPVEAESDVNTMIPKKRKKLFKRPDAPDVSVLIDTVTKLQVDRTPSGAIIIAEGVATRQGAFGAELRATNLELVSEAGILSLDFRVLYPSSATAVGSERSRTVVEAFSVTNQQMQGVRTIRVTAAKNQRESRRR